MATEKQISELEPAAELRDDDLLLVQQDGVARRIKGAEALAKVVDGWNMSGLNSFYLTARGKPIIGPIGPFSTGNGSIAQLQPLTIEEVSYDGSVEVDMTEAVEAVVQRKMMSVKRAGAKGDGSTDDTAAFQKAMSESRVVYVPGGTYKLSDTLVIKENSGLILSQDTVLKFTQTSDNCISLGMLSNLKGNHATVKVPYEFEGKVLYAYSNDTSEADIKKVPPFSQWDPQWKSGRYVTDLNICKADSRGFHYCVNPGECKGSAVYLSADFTVGKSTFMWGIYMSGLRIAGAFSYGIRCVNIDNAWMHEMRIDNTFIDACEIGVSLEDCNNTYISATIQPRRGYTQDKVYFPYAKHGIQLIRSRNTDLSGSRVWDWNNPDDPNTDENEKTTLYEIDNEYQHISMIGNCTGTIINDFMYYAHGDTRQRIYTDYTYNLETLTILQEPINRWFKVIDDEPYYDNGLVNKKLLSEDGLKEYFDTETVKSFTDVLSTATDKDGTIYNGIGYKIGGYLSGGGEVIDTTFCTVTGFIPLKRGQKMYVEGMSFASYVDMCKVYTYDANKAPIRPISAEKLTSGTNWHMSYGKTQSGFWASLNSVVDNADVAYVRFSVLRTQTSTNPMIAIDEEIKYTIVGTLADGIKVKGENIIGTPGQITPDWVATKKETGGETIVIAEQTITSGMWSKRQMDIQLGIPYEVYINGKRYTCVPYDYDGGIVLGNYTIANKNANVPHNNEPFYIYWAGGSATAGMFDKDSTLSYPITLKVTDQIVEVYNKMPEGYLPDGVVMDDAVAPLSKDIGEWLFTSTVTFDTDSAATSGKQLIGVTLAVTSGAEYWLEVNGDMTKCLCTNTGTGTWELRDASNNRWVRKSIGKVYVYGQSAGTYTYNLYDLAENIVVHPSYIPSNVARKSDISTSGSGIDVTAEVGQTIRVKEVDSNGKPTKWEAVDYQPRTHWTETTEILPETTVECAEVDEDEDGVGDGLFMGMLPEDISLTPNADYSVIYNGASYVCKAVLVSDDAASRIFALGNIGPFGVGANTGEPFAVRLAYSPSEGYSENVIVSFDGSASVTLSITEVNCTPVPVQYVTNAFPYYIDVCTAEDGTMSIKETSMELYTIHASGRQMVARYETSADALKTYVMYYLDDVCVMNDLFIVEMMFCRIPMTKMVGHGYLFFKFANDGTVTISKSID